MKKSDWHSQISTLTMAELKSFSLTDIALLDMEVQSLFATSQEAALRRAKANKIDLLIQEFRASLCCDVTPFDYELAYHSSWYLNNRSLYDHRWWINGYIAGVYFIYDQTEALEYIGSSCGGALGNRIYETSHHPYQEFVDIVLFDRQCCHFALAFEAFAVSRLKPPRNTEFKFLDIPPLNSFASNWVMKCRWRDLNSDPSAPS